MQATTDTNTTNIRLRGNGILNVGTDCAKLVKNKLATSGVACCWSLIVFLTENYIYIRHLSSVALPVRGSSYCAQRILEKMVEDMDEYIERKKKSHLNIEYVCLLGGMEDPGNYLSILGDKTTHLCLNRPHVVTYKTKYVTSEHLLKFLDKIVYINLNMNEKISKISGGDDDGTGLTIFAESIDQIRRLSLLIFAFGKMTTVFVLDPSQSRPNLTFKTRNPPQNPLENMIQNKNIEFPTSSNIYFPPLANIDFNFYSFSTLHYILRELCPNLREPSKEEEDNPNALSSVTDDEDEYFNPIINKKN